MSEERDSEADGSADADEGKNPADVDAGPGHAPADLSDLTNAAIRVHTLGGDTAVADSTGSSATFADGGDGGGTDPETMELDDGSWIDEDELDPSDPASVDEASFAPADEDGVDAEAGDDEASDEEASEAPSGPTPDELLPDEELDRVVEALLFASASALTPARIAKAAGGVSPRRVRRSIKRLRSEYEADLRAFDILEIGGGFRLYSRPEYEEYVARLERMRAPERLSATSLETLAIVAYRQPIIRAEVDAIRGVQSGPILRSLMERKLVRVVGRSDQPGRPLLYGTTKRFLDHFGLASVKDLPRVEDLKAP